MPLLQMIILLPLIELIGSIEIGAKIGIGFSLLWIFIDILAGFALLFTLLGSTMAQAKPAEDISDAAVQNNLDAAAQHALERMFDGFCIMVAALLLISPGFISDFLALPLLIPPVRHWVYNFLREKHQELFHNINQSSQGFSAWYYEERSPMGVKTIEGVFTHTDAPPADTPQDDTKQIK